jgi:hypothetical protein
MDDVLRPVDLERRPVGLHGGDLPAGDAPRQTGAVQVIGPNQSPKPVRLSPQVQAALSVQEPQYPPSMRPKVKQAAAWRSFYAALRANPDATFEGAS